MRKTILIMILCLAVLQVRTQEIRGLYVNKIDLILGNPKAEADLFTYIRECRFNHLLFYSLNRINFQDSGQLDLMRNFLHRLRTQCGVNRIGAVGENFEFFLDRIHPYNMNPETDSTERFDVYDLEFEFWSNSGVTGYYCDHYLRPAGFPCTSDGAFDYVKKTLLALKAMKSELPGLETEVYIGWIRADQSAQLPPLVDRILPAVYVSARNDGSLNLYNFAEQRQRLRDLASGGSFKLLPIFNGDKDSYDPDLYPWLMTGHSVCEPWLNYYAGFLDDNDPIIKANVNLEGYHWFKYSGMPPVPTSLVSPGPIQGPVFPEIGYPHIYIIPSIKDADLITWWLASTGMPDTISPAQREIPVTFSFIGQDTLFVQSFSCGAKSKVISLPLDVKDIGMGQEVIDQETGPVAFRAWSVAEGIRVIPGLTSDHSGYLTVVDALGRCIYRHTIRQGDTGELIIPAGSGLFLVSFNSGSKRYSEKIVR